jgi:hypothetical protein
MLVRDVEQTDVVVPAIRLLRGFVDTFGDELLPVGQDFDLVHYVIG